MKKLERKKAKNLTNQNAGTQVRQSLLDLRWFLHDLWTLGLEPGHCQEQQATAWGVEKKRCGWWVPWTH
jgi:hypothetical protein